MQCKFYLIKNLSVVAKKRNEKLTQRNEAVKYERQKIFYLIHVLSMTHYLSISTGGSYTMTTYGDKGFLRLRELIFILNRRSW